MFCESRSRGIYWIWNGSRAKLRCMSERLLDAAGVMRLLRFCPTMLAPGSVVRVLQRYRRKEQPVPFMEHFEQEIKEWQQSTRKWLQAAERQGVDFPVNSLKLQDWIARAEAMLLGPESASGDAEDADAAPFTEELVKSAKHVLKEKQDAEKQEKEFRLVHAIDRLHKSANNRKTRSIYQRAGRQRRASVTHAEAQFYQELWRFGDRESTSLCNANDFTKSLLSKYDNLANAWDKLDVNGNGTVDFHEFVLGCRKIQINGKLRQIFSQLSSDGVLLHITDLDPKLGHEEAKRKERYKAKKEARFTVRQTRHDLPALKRLNMPMERQPNGDFNTETVEIFAKNRVPNGTFRQSKAGVGRASLVQTSGEVQSYLNMVGHAAPLPDVAQDFHQVLLKRYRTLPAAWDELDSNEDGVLQFHEFVAACRKLHFRGNMKQMFIELCSGKFGHHEDHSEGDPKQVLRMTDLDASMKEEAERRVNLGIERKQMREQEHEEHSKSQSPHRNSTRSSMIRASIIMEDNILPAIEDGSKDPGRRGSTRHMPSDDDRAPFVC